jgi:hypothetical protein
MSKSFVISIEGDANANEFLQFIQNHKTVGIRVKRDTRGVAIKYLPVLFIYPTTDTIDEPAKPDHRPNPKTGHTRRPK